MGRRLAIRVAAGLVALILVGIAAVAYTGYALSNRLSEPARLDIPVGAPTNPRQAYRLAYRQVDVPAPIGKFPAWYLPVRGSTWALVVHGWGAPKAEALPMLPILHRLGLSVLVVSYRGDPGAPASSDGLSHLAASEWRDLQSAAIYARNHGARRLVLVGYSMGGAIVCNFLRFSPQSQLVGAVILDAPVLDWNGVLRALANRDGVPSQLVPITELVISQRIGFSFARYDQLAHAAAFHAPILILHGTNDQIVPFQTSQQFARLRPDLVTLVPFPGAGHTQAWTSNPARYDSAIERFLAATLTHSRPA